jgi:hypothetical protein
MDWKAFIASIVASMAWPSVLIVLLILLREQLGSLATRIEEFTLPGGAKAKFKAQLESNRDKLEEVGSLGSLDFQKRDQPDDAYLELAKNFPEAAVSHAWKDVEEVLLQIRELLGEAHRKSHLNSVVRRLREQGLIDGATEELFLSLRQARNTAVHAHENAVITPAEAVEYREQVRALAALFRNALERLPRKKEQP